MIGFRRWLGLVIVIAAIFAAACAAPVSAPAPAAAPAPEEPLPVQFVRAAYEGVAAAKSYEINFRMSMESAAAESMLTIEGAAVYFLSPAEVRLTANTTLRAGAGEPVRTTLEQYILADGAGLTIFLQRDGRWTKTLLDSPELSRVLAMDPAADLKLFMENLQMAELAGEETLDERTAHKIIVRVAGAALSELLPAEGETPNPVGSEAARFLAEGGDLQLTLWLDAENLALLKCQADLTQFMRKLAAGVDAFAARRNLDAATAKALKTALSDIKAEMEYTVAKLNNATPFVLPAEAALAEITPAAPSLTNPAP